MIRSLHFISLLAIVTATCGCSTAPENPAFPLTIPEAKAALADMAADPRPLDRPVLVLGGFRDVGFGAPSVARAIRSGTGDDRVVDVSFGLEMSFDACRSKAIAAMDRRFPSDDPARTVAVDVVAISMGGLVARAAALPRDGTRALSIARLFTISSPHRGASLAALPTFDRLQLDMRAGSAFLAAIDEAWIVADYPIYPYARLNDAIVGVENTAPPGMIAWWVAPPGGVFGHLGAHTDLRIRADVLRRLRYEPPLTRIPTARPPDAS